MQLNSPENFINRELSWLNFNSRVLAEAENPEVPLLERLKFLAIVSGNLDEYFMVRVALMYRELEASAKSAPGPDGMTPHQTLKLIAEHAHEMVDRQYKCLMEEVMPAISKEGINIIRPEDMTKSDRDYLHVYFTEQIRPALTPMAIDTGHPFPLLTNLARYFLFKVKPRETEGQRFFSQANTVLMQVPTGLKRFLPLSCPEGKIRFAIIDDVIGMFIEDLLRGYEIQGAYPFRVTRDAEFTVDDERADDLLAAIEQELRSRRRGEPVRLEVAGNVPAPIVKYLREQLELDSDGVYTIPSVLDLKTMFELIGGIDRPDLSNPVWQPQLHPDFIDRKDVFGLIREKDVILHHPYQNFDPVVNFLNQAANDPDVLAIKITLYRVSGSSPLVRALIRAAESGKQVTVLVELRARFDEEANINWAKRLDSAGAHVIYGVVGYKTHSKVCLVVRRETEGIRKYVHLGTGNYNDSTARLYTDVGLFTSSTEIGADISAFFNVITGYSLPPAWNRIEMSPTGMRDRIISMINREVDKHSPETPGFIRAKMNALVDPAVINALYKASLAGVKIELVVRGLCRLRAGVKGLSENITVISIVDRFLEHPRIFHFHNGGNDELYCASADWMERNFDRRLELLFPIISPANRRQVMQILTVALEDNTKAWALQPDNTYIRVNRGKREKPRRSQEILYQAAVKMMSRMNHSSGQRTFIAKTSPESSRNSAL